MFPAPYRRHKQTIPMFKPERMRQVPHFVTDPRRFD